MRIVAIDWSGAKADGGRRDIAIAECVDGRLLPVRAGLSRDAVRHWLLEQKAGNPEIVVGLDFAFSVPAWFAGEILQVRDVMGVWDVVAREGENWLDGSARWPFWGRGEQVGSSNLPLEKAFRQTEQDVGVLTSTRPKSVFQLVGSGQVGPGSLRGMPMLRDLREGGFAVWPFDACALPLVIEIYPRLFTDDVTKSSLNARAAFLASFGGCDGALVGEMAATEHAFDAACSALAMSRHLGQLTRLGREDYPYSLEGKIWAPTGAPVSRQPRAPGFAVASLQSNQNELEEFSAAKRPSTSASIPGLGGRMVRVMRKHVSGFDDMSSDTLAERIDKLETLLEDPDHTTLHQAARSQLMACRQALEPDFAHTKVHHASNCWYVDRYEEGCFPGGAKRQFVLVPVESVLEGVRGCHFCESGRPAAVKLRKPASLADGPAAANPESTSPGPATGISTARVGAIVRAVDLTSGENVRWELVGPGESEPTTGKLSSTSPIGKALIGRHRGDLVDVSAPRGIRHLKLIDVSYQTQ